MVFNFNVSETEFKKITENYKKSVASFLNSSEKTSKSDAEVTQTVKIVMRYAKGCDIVVGQTAEIKVKLVQFDVDKLVNDVDVAFTDKVVEDVTQAIEQTNEGIGFGDTNLSSLRQEVQNINKVELQKDIKNIFKEEISSFNKIAQENVLEITECYDSSLNLNQYASIDNLSERIAERLITNKETTDVSTESDTKATQSAKQTNSGIFGGGGVWMILILVLLVMMFSGGDSK
jgi:hypothetical protein